jgi:hypothetical protein
VTYATLMVHLELGQSNAGLLGLAGDLAAHFQTGLIGIAACQPMEIVYSEAYVSAEILGDDRAQRESEIKLVEAEFRSPLQAASVPPNGVPRLRQDRRPTIWYVRQGARTCSSPAWITTHRCSI